MNPNAVYQKIRMAQKQGLKFFYLSIPTNMTLSKSKQRNLQNLTETEIIYLDEANLIHKLNQKITGLRPNIFISVSRRGQYLYEELKRENNAWINIPHYNLKISRKNLSSLSLPQLSAKKFVIIDDIFCSGLTLASVISNIGRNKKISCLFLFGPQKVISEFRASYPKVSFFSGYEFEPDPREVGMEFTDLESLRDLLRKHGSNSVLIKGVFGQKAFQAKNIILSKRKHNSHYERSE